jgi:regulator of protease activity HflC (stomatin/prohibitin superfamily)
VEPGLIVLIVLAVFVLFVAARSIRIVPQARAGVVERLGRFNRTLMPGLTVIVPFVDRVKPLIDLREQVVSFAPQPVITEDNLVVQIDTVIYFTVTDPKAVTYEVANPLQAIEQLTVTTLRNVIGGMTLEDTLTSRDQINSALRSVLDEATGKWGIRVNRVELKSVDPPTTIQQAMEKQMRAERDRRAAILNAEGTKQSQILTAEGERQSSVLRAQGQREAEILHAEGQAKAIATVFEAIHNGRPDRELLSYQYLQMLPQLAQGPANKIFIIPSEFSQALGQLGEMFGAGRGPAGAPANDPGPAPAPPSGQTTSAADEEALRAASAAAEKSLAEAEAAANAAASEVATSTPGGIPHPTGGSTAPRLPNPGTAASEAPEPDTERGEDGQTRPPYPPASS